MVRAYFPQRFPGSLVTNTNYSPQGATILERVLIQNPLLAIYPPIADNTFQFYKFYQIKKGQIPSLQLNTALVIIDTLGNGILQEGSGFDIRVFDSVGSPIAYEVQSVNITTGEIIVWVNMAQAQDSEFVQLVFGKPSATDGSNPNVVYDSNYKSVYHLNGVGTDSTSNAQDLTIFGTTTVAAKIGDGIDFPGLASEYLIRQPYNGFPPTTVTFEYWIKTTDRPFGLLSYAASGQIMAFSAFFSNSQILTIQVIENLFQIPQTIDDGNFHHIVTTWRSSDGQMIYYLDGVNVSSATLSVGESIVDGGALVLAQEQDSVGGGFNDFQSLDGIMDEVRVSDIVRGPDYVETVFNNQDDNDAFWFKTPILENGEDNFLVDDQGRNIVVVQ